MGNSTMSLKSGHNHQDSSWISNDTSKTFKYNDIINYEEEQMNIIYIRNRIKKQQYEESKNSNNINNKIPTMFEWSFKGNNVYLTGSFCNWKEFFLMKKDENGIFRLVLDLNRGFHQYKFKIDNEWKYNKNFPIYNDNGFINNYIDTSNWEIKGEYENEEINKNLFSTSEIDILNYFKEKDINLKLSEEFYKANINYCNYKPLKNELFNIPPQFPYQFIIDLINKDLKINEDKKNINDIKNKNNKENKNNNEFIIINNNKNKKNNNNMLLYSNKLFHEQINHLHIRKTKDTKPIVNSIFSRYRLKFTTFIYYK